MDVLDDLLPGVELYFIGCEGGFEKRFVPSRGRRLEVIPGSPFARQGLLGRAKAPLNLLRGAWAARELLRRNGTGLVLGLGGYASVGAVAAAKTLGVPAIIHEANVFPGLANRLAGHFADRILVGWEETKERFPESMVTGSPAHNVHFAEQAPEPPGERPRILVTGGSEGSPFLNERAWELVARLETLDVRARVLHQTGLDQADAVRRLYAEQRVDAECVDLIDDMAAAYRDADFVVATAGAITIAEIAAHALPCLLVPLGTAAEGHQCANAGAYAKRSGALWTRESEWNPHELGTRIAALFRSPEVWAEKAKRAHALRNPDAAARIARHCAALFAGAKA